MYLCSNNLHLLMVLLINLVNGDEFLSSGLSVQDQCANICTENSFLLPRLDLINYEQVVCQRGCRFFNIVSFKDEHDLNVTKKECYLSCEESYILKNENQVCNIGCDLMLKKRENEMSTFLIFSEQDNSNDIMFVEPDLELLENDLLSDPSIRGQIEIGYNIAFKIPETHIRTMPIKDVTNIPSAFIIKTANQNNGGDWLDCASRNSGIPRWILLTAILSAVLVALWLSFSTDKKSVNDALEIEKCDTIKHEYIPEKNTTFLIANEKEVNFSSPPKYTVSSENV